MKNLLLLLLLCFAACKKTKETGPDTRKFTGLVLDYSTGQPIANALVKIIRLPGNLIVQGIQPGLVKDLHTDLFRNIRVDSMLTNSEGKYEVELDGAHPPYSRYMVAAWKDGYIHPYILPALHQMDSTDFKDTAYLDRNTYLKVIPDNQPPAAATDTLGIRTFYLDSFSQVSYIRPGTGDSASFIGTATNAFLLDTISAKAFPRARVVWTVIRNGSVFFRDSQVVDLVPFTVNEFPIHY